MEELEETSSLSSSSAQGVDSLLFDMNFKGVGYFKILINCLFRQTLSWTRCLFEERRSGLRSALGSLLRWKVGALSIFILHPRFKTGGDHQSGVAAVGTSCEAGGWCIPSEHLDVFPANQHNSEFELQYIQDQSHNNWFSLQKYHLYSWICLIMVCGFLVFGIFRYFIDWRGWGHRRLSCRGTAWGEWASVWVHDTWLKLRIFMRKLRATWRKVASYCWSMPN